MVASRAGTGSVVKACALALVLVLVLSLAVAVASAELAQQGPRIKATGEVGEGLFGSSVALSSDGNTAAVGAPYDDGELGAVFIFTRSGETWSQQAKLTATGEVGNARLGSSVAITGDGNTVIAGAPRDSSSAGAAWVFTRSGESWSQQAKLTGTGAVGAGALGSSVAISDTLRAAVGGSADNGGAGAVWMFVYSAGWAQQGEKLTGAGEIGAGQFGSSVAMTDGKLVVGGPGDNGGFGAVWPYTRTGSGWVAQGEKLVGSEEASAARVGTSIALSADAGTALAGGPAGPLYGAAWVFTRSGESWLKTNKKIRAHFATEGARFGSGVALSGDAFRAFIGGPGEESETGAAWEFAGGFVQQAGAITGELTEPFSEFGAAVAISRDGQTAIAGGPLDSGATGTVWAFLNHPFALKPPELGRCKKVNPGEGSYGNSACTALLGGGKHEWFPRLIKEGFTLNLAEGNVKLETTTATKVLCAGEHASGEFEGRREAARIKIVLTGCELSGAKCSSESAGEGEILTSSLGGELGMVEFNEVPGKNKAGMPLSPEHSAEPVMAFTCGATSVSIRGGVILPLPTPKMALVFRFKPTATKGKQKPEHLLEGPTEVLEASFDGGAYQQIGLSAILNLTFEEKAELNVAY
jgi:FG-GAP repeat